jgi:transposase InsO family protein
MPWKTSAPVDLRIEFMQRLFGGERMVDLCVEYGISRKTASKFKQRFESYGRSGLIDRSRAPRYIPHKTSPELEKRILAARANHPTWGPKKLKKVLEKRFKEEFPAASTIGEVLTRAGLVRGRKRRPRRSSTPSTLGIARGPNDIWAIDYKGQFRLGDGSYCFPLTLTDQFSRFLLGCEAMAGISDTSAREVCEELFRRHGLPRTIRSDNGVPFASRGLASLTKLSAYWMLLGIRLERIRPAHPEENGRHERMHRTLKLDATKPPRTNLLQQQERFDAFVQEYNHERPHEALAMRCPVDVHKPSIRRYPAVVPEPEYPGYDDVLKVSASGFVYIKRTGSVYVSQALAGLHVGLHQQPDDRWLLTFVDLDLGLVDRRSMKLMPLA